MAEEGGQLLADRKVRVKQERGKDQIVLGTYFLQLPPSPSLKISRIPSKQHYELGPPDQCRGLWGELFLSKQ